MHALRALRPRLSRSTATGWHRLISVAGLTVLAVVGPAAAAYATDTVVQDRGQVRTSSEQNLRVHSGRAASGLYPGAHGDLSLMVTNRGEHAVTTTSVTHVGTVVTGSPGGCGAADFTVPRRMPSSTVIPAGQTRELVVPGAITMNDSAGNGCQGVDVRVISTVSAS